MYESLSDLILNLFFGVCEMIERSAIYSAPALPLEGAIVTVQIEPSQLFCQIELFRAIQMLELTVRF